MKTAIKLVLIYLGIQLLSTVVVSIATLIDRAVRDNLINHHSNNQYQTLAIAMFISFIAMTIYLWKAGYISTDRRTWSPVSVAYLVVTALASLSAILIIEFLQSTLMPWLPNLMENTFDTLQSGWLGILSIAVFGPVLEELLFRGAITTVLLKEYRPGKAIVLSALVFGIFHINPAQVVAGILIGLLLAWVYYRTGSLVPCILIHVLNNSLSVYLSAKYPEAEYLKDLFSGDSYMVVLIAAVVMLIGSIFWMKRRN